MESAAQGNKAESRFPNQTERLKTILLGGSAELRMSMRAGDSVSVFSYVFNGSARARAHSCTCRSSPAWHSLCLSSASRLSLRYCMVDMTWKRLTHQTNASRTFSATPRLSLHSREAQASYMSDFPFTLTTNSRQTRPCHALPTSSSTQTIRMSFVVILSLMPWPMFPTSYDLRPIFSRTFYRLNVSPLV